MQAVQASRALPSSTVNPESGARRLNLMNSENRAQNPATAAELSGPVAALLRELSTVTAQLSPEQYTRPADEAFFKGTIGGHVRHCLDHIRSLLDGFITGVVDYDHRERGTDIESNPIAARDEMRRLWRLADEAGLLSAETPVTVVVMPTRDGKGVSLTSTLGRELSFVLSHTIHHNAMIKGMACALGLSLPSAFGYAPSTLAHKTTEKTPGASSCAR